MWVICPSLDKGAPGILRHMCYTPNASWSSPQTRWSELLPSPTAMEDIRLVPGLALPVSAIDKIHRLCFPQDPVMNQLYS